MMYSVSYIHTILWMHTSCIERRNYTVTVTVTVSTEDLLSLLETLESLSTTTSGVLSEGDPSGTRNGTKNTGSIRHKLFKPTQYEKFE